MTYVIRHTDNSAMLYDATPRQAVAWVAGKHDQVRHGVWFEPVCAARAHSWVRRGHPHATALWIDDNDRIRRA